MGVLNIFKKNSLDADGLIDKLNDRADKINFSNQERSEFNLKIADAWAGFAKDTLSENTERSKARRSMAQAIVYSYLFTFFALILLYWFNPDLAKFVQQLAIDWKLTFAFVTVICFFFGSYLLKGTPLKQ